MCNYFISDVHFHHAKVIDMDGSYNDQNIIHRGDKE